ncbi:hypothetical protein LINPERHAP1_LOCUS7509 [Linum perenne]
MASSNLKDAVIFHVLGRRVPFMIMNNRIQNLWAVRGQVRITDMGAGFFTARFDSSEDYRRALLEGPWKIGEHYIVPRMWQEGFDPCTDTLSQTLVWVRLPGLPLEFFTETFLRRIGDKIGKLVRIDPTTLAMERGNYARICVRVDLSKKLLSKYKLLHRVRRVEYEGLHVVCFKCGIYGHTIDICPTGMTSAEKDGEHVHSNPLFLEEVLAKERPEVFEEFGPWMLAKSRSKRNAGAASTPAARTPIPTAKHSAPLPTAPGPPQGSRFTVLVDDSQPTSQSPQMPTVERASSTPFVAAPIPAPPGVPKKQKGKKAVVSTPDGEASSVKPTGKRTSKVAAPKGKGTSQVSILKRQRPVVNKTAPAPSSVEVSEAILACSQVVKDATRTNGISPHDCLVADATGVIIDMNVDPPTDVSVSRSGQ